MRGWRLGVWGAVLSVPLGLGCVIGSLWLMQAPLASASMNHLVAEPRERNLGVLRQAEMVQTSFRLRNSSKEAIELVAVQTSCGCAAAIVGEKQLQPGATSDLTVQFATGTARGRRTAVVQLVYRGLKTGHQRLLILPVTATVEPDYDFQPAQVQFARGESATSTVRFWAVRQADFAISDVYVESSALNKLQVTASCVPPEPGRSDWVIVVEYQPGEGESVLDHAQVVVKTNSVREPICRIPVGWIDRQTVNKP